MGEQAPYTSHLLDTNNRDTACGEPWQGWQAPETYSGDTIPPNQKPISHQTQVRLCNACKRISDLNA